MNINPDMDREDELLTVAKVDEGEQDTSAVQEPRQNWNPDRYRTNLNPFFLSPCSVESRDATSHETAKRYEEVEAKVAPIELLFDHNEGETPQGNRTFKKGMLVGALIGGSVSLIGSLNRLRHRNHPKTDTNKHARK
ncbi:hypothetical protein [Exiguobacterium flavidum]|uniref:hypothetical protein n=1 Tax=Exiguobacterium flavidum TaxID=2184695 RepID=UPI000DF7F6D5|nr:hypothetical protein [Exiguobacterium flavidum]